ncbi:ferredoxin--NADP reductase [Roseivirga sp.]|uniref:ferredoxin--NADP reductase n=1 Tax=Roseivirga sp. TaxID=1964215 RepID=UPI002B26CDBC|nr:ferredoxin--NADP reductase [Roseivirga sp.]
MAFGLFKKKQTEKSEIPSVKAGHLNVTVKEVVNETADAISIYFEQPDSGTIQYKAGQFFTLIANINGKQERRAYSLCTSPFVDQYPAVTVKRVEGGLMSNHLGDNLKAGDVMEVLEPIGNFVTTFDSNNERHIVLFGGGSGITPLMSIAKSALSQEPKSMVSLIYANRDTDSIIFKSALEKLELDNSDRFKVIHVLGEAPSEWKGFTGFLTQEIIKQTLESLPQMASDQTEFFMCGPGPMMDIVEASLSNLNIPKAQVHKESFTSDAGKKKEKAAVSNEIIAREVTVIYDGEEFKYTVEPGETILEKGLEEDIDLPFSCQSGLCTACRGKCVSGKVKMDEDEGLSEAELNEGYVLPCVSHPLTEDVVIEIG